MRVFDAIIIQGNSAVLEVNMSDVVRIPVNEARSRVLSGDALLVCAYDSDEKYSANRLEGSISYSASMEMLPSLPKQQEIIVYCA